MLTNLWYYQVIDFILAKKRKVIDFSWCMPAWYKLIEISANQSVYQDTHKAYNIYEKKLTLQNDLKRK